jgi:hypothetical protein
MVSLNGRRMKALLPSALILGILAGPAYAGTPASAAPDATRLKADVEAMVRFGTRHTASSTSDQKRGIGAARHWAAMQFERAAKLCGNCLIVERVADRFSGPRVPEGVIVENVLAIQPGSAGMDHVIILAAHIDSRASDVMNATIDAPGANDNASGSALVLESARLLSRQKHRATIVYALLSGEEQGLWGGELLARTAKARGWKVTALLNNDIVGNTVGTDGRVVADRVRVFSEGIRASEDLTTQQARRGSGGEDDGPSRALARYIAGVAARNTDAGGLAVFAVRRPDRFGRGGDHLPALAAGLPAVRFTVGVENYDAQHQDLRTVDGRVYGDTPERMDFPYLAKVTALNAATARALAAAPPAPTEATLGGAVSSDTIVRWSGVPSASGYRIYTRPADGTRDWAPALVVSDPAATSATLSGLIVDDTFVGVAALGDDGRDGAPESLITFAGLPPRR